MKHHTCLQSSPTLKMAACQTTRRAASAFSSPSSRESEVHALLLQLTHPAALHLELGQVGSLGRTARWAKHMLDTSRQGRANRKSLASACTERTSAWGFLTCSRCPGLWLLGCWGDSSLQTDTPQWFREICNAFIYCKTVLQHIKTVSVDYLSPLSGKNHSSP